MVSIQNNNSGQKNGFDNGIAHGNTSTANDAIISVKNGSVFLGEKRVNMKYEDERKQLKEKVVILKIRHFHDAMKH